MALELVIAGHYNGSYSSVDLGITRNGFELQQESKGEAIEETDAFGQSIIDFIYRGGNVYIMFDCKIWKEGTLTPFWPWGGDLGLAGFGVMYNAGNPISRRAQDAASALLMTVTANTPAAGGDATITTLTASKAILPPGSSMKLLFSSKTREVPQRLLCLPSDSDGSAGDFATGTWFTTT
jgi:hypothetical protein